MSVDLSNIPPGLLTTPPQDPKNPNTNQAKHCYYKYNEFFRCEKFRGAGAEQCQEIKAAFISLCPNDWVAKWDEQRANNTSQDLSEPAALVTRPSSPLLAPSASPSPRRLPALGAAPAASRLEKTQGTV
eukprot:CAMPEP_0172183642 /NCGR_PEP_ID=MMETSP1050-20130122/19107_1 /TAXON_ID=233186 /ORGANISM="Cryptomonas curvata, Strain CCAP979/52" /LENGTH=128 /DNA_ID=CAMNT_0012857299 /DNA_START=5 /DNA_END=389 /DNA_ORIENTATION=+